MRKIYCDRCGREVDREESRIVPSFTTWDVARYMRRKLPLEMQQLAGKDFCRDCIADIVDFALNGKACDECVQQMMDENAIQDIRKGCQYQSGKHVIPLQPIDPELIRKYKALQQIGGSCVGNEIEKIPE